uniref:Uncharacterized protein n=1 Tax=Pristionchus pacificus TaxID=54126 RepID=A0A2A6BUV0_PRIPA|eukprot:PDM69679.1 hypothetical protein PRIPAC_44775 [Pristionchus pacificus]
MGALLPSHDSVPPVVTPREMANTEFAQAQGLGQPTPGQTVTRSVTGRRSRMMLGLECWEGQAIWFAGNHAKKTG